ncbi:acetyl-CoA carboxylase [Tuber borchii]|uniref:Acetyl-CoA carboxylase n=1 Tax=Tuber borchii TaxID=42251 RepID=A0A2T6ZEI7_TUBBO|nr:acetyl-CoA carboxylase [Tuber borchii]
MMATPEDLQANADYICMADQYVEVPGELIVDAAERMGVHAVGAGWLGYKISSTIIAQHAEVPCIPWSRLGVREVQIDSEGLVTIAGDVYAKGCTHLAEDALQKALEIGFSVMIKASESGGGKGIRKVQLLADKYGNNISLFGRNCSVHRRHQKIIEEAPVTVANQTTFSRIEKAAVRLGKLVRYVSASSIEYLYSHSDDKFYFLELNPSLQVEHPTTEMVTSLSAPLEIVGTKPPQRFTLLTTVLKNIIDGYNNQAIMATSLKELIQVLRDPKLPYREWKLDPIFSQVIERSKSRKGESPAKQLRKTLDKFLEENIAAGDIELLKFALLPLTEIMDRYSKGLKVYELSVPLGLMEQYWSIEKLFSGQNTCDEDIILRLHDENRDDINNVVQAVLFHSKIASKNNLILAILEEYRPNKPNNGSIIKFFRPILKKLTKLESQRAAQIEHILRSSVVESQYGETGWGKEVIDSKYTVFDVLPIFFAHADSWISLAALEVYVRQAYRAYELHAINYHNLNSEPPFIVTWDYQLKKIGTTEYGMTQPSALATSTVERGDRFKHVGSISDLSFLVRKSGIEPVRKGVIIPITFLDEAEEYHVCALELIPLGKGAKRSMPLSVLETEEEEDSLPAVCNVAVRDAKSMDDKDHLERILPLVADHKDELLSRTVRRINFICRHRDGSYPGYFTFRGPEYREEQSIRHIEPALAFQLELGRLSNFTIKPVFTENGNIQVYEVYDEIPTADYLISETDRLINDILDALEMIGNNNSDLNHIFINFTPVSPLSPEEIEPARGGCIEHFGRLVIICTDPKSGLAYPLCVIIQNASGYVIQVEMYTERKTDKGQWPKRHKAHLMGTQYVDDFPELFRQAFHQSWLKSAKKVPSFKERIPPLTECLEYSELVLDDNGGLAEVQRELGTNAHGMVGWVLTAKTPEHPFT